MLLWGGDFLYKKMRRIVVDFAQKDVKFARIVTILRFYVIITKVHI